MSVRSILCILPFMMLSAAGGLSPSRGAAVSADTTGTVVGRLIRVSDGSPEPYAIVIVLGTRRGAQADEDGRFVITLVPPGPHPLKIVRVGHPQMFRDIVVTVGRNDMGDISLPYPFTMAPIEIGSRAVVQAKDLETTLRALQRFRVGDKPSLEARIRNRGKSPVVLVRSTQASDRWASPRVWIDITGPDSGFFVPPRQQPLLRENDGVTPGHFERVAPGAEFDPWAAGSLDRNLVEGRFLKPGRYRATFHYDTTETNGRNWMGEPCGICEMPASLREILEEVPAVSLSAAVEFDVVP